MLDKIRTTNSLAVIVIIVLGCLFYGSSLFNEFVYNDHQMVSENPFIKSFENIKHFFGEKYFTGSQEKTFRPVVTLSFMLDHFLWGGAPAGYHFTNMLVHILNGILLYFLLTFFVSSLPPERSTKIIKGGHLKASLPLLAAVLFIAHPVETEGVLSVGSRHDLVMSFFYLAAFLFYYFAFRKSAKKTLFLSISLILFMLSMLSKEMGVTLPLMLILMDIVVYGLIVFRARVKYYALYFLMALVFMIIRFFLVTYSVDSGGDYYSAEYFYGGNYFSHLLTSVSVLGYYIKLFVFPVSLSLEYIPRVITSVLDPAFIVSVLAISGIVFVCVKSAKKHPFIAVGGFWMLITLLPVSNIFILLLSTSMSERFLYLPAAGFNIFLAGVIFWMSARSGLKMQRVLLACAVGLIALYGARTVYRTFDWRNEKVFWEASARDEAESFRTHNNLAMVYFYEGKYEKAIEELNLSLGIRDDSLTRVNLAFAYYEQGKISDAQLELDRVLEKDPRYAPALYHLALVKLNQGRRDEAQELLKSALREYPRMKDRPFYAEAFNALGSVYLSQGDYDAAVNMYKSSLEVNPDFIQPRYLMAKVFIKKGLMDKAEQEYLVILRREPSNIDARNNLANIYFSKGHVEKAQQEYLRILDEAPGHFRARNNLANIYLSRGEYDKAIKEYSAVLKSNPNSAIVYYNLGLAFAGKGLHRESVVLWEKALTIDPELAPARNALNGIKGIHEEK